MAHSFTGSLVPCSSMWPLRAKKTLTIHIQTMDVDMEFSVPYKITGREVFEKVSNTIGLRETWYFGLRNHSCNKADMQWIQEDKRIIDQVYMSNDSEPINLYLLGKFYPVNVTDLIQDLTKHLFFLQVKDQILSQEIFAPAEKCVLLASYALQAKYGDYDPVLHKPGKLGPEQLIPEQIMKQYQLTREGWEEKSIAWYSQHAGQSKEWAEMQYLIVSQDLSMFGVNYFLIQNKKGTDLWLGVDASGIQIFEKNDQIKAKICFPWSEVKNISFQDKKFTIKPANEKCDDFKFFTRKIRTNKMILQLCVGNHSLYMRQHKEDSLIVQALKQQAKEEKKRKQLEQHKLEKERKLKDEALRQREELELRLRRFEGQARRANDKLQRSEEAAETLEEKVKIAEEHALLLAKQATQAQEQIYWLKQENSKSNEALLKQVVEAEDKEKDIAAKAEVVAQEAYRLKRELEQARQRELVAKQRLMDITQQNVMHDQSDVLQYVYSEQPEEDQDLVTQIDNARLEEKMKSDRVKSQLNSLRTKMEELKVDGVDVPIEYLDEDKYQTLKRITAGETRSRIAFFHSL